MTAYVCTYSFPVKCVKIRARRRENWWGCILIIDSDVCAVVCKSLESDLLVILKVPLSKSFPAFWKFKILPWLFLTCVQTSPYTWPLNFDLWVKVQSVGSSWQSTQHKAETSKQQLWMPFKKLQWETLTEMTESCSESSAEGWGALTSIDFLVKIWRACSWRRWSGAEAVASLSFTSEIWMISEKLLNPELLLLFESRRRQMEETWTLMKHIKR